MPAARPLDVDFVRSLYPDAAWDWAFFENAGGSFVPQSVIDRLTAYMTECQVQPGGPFPQGELAQQRMDAGHRLMAEMINAEPDEVTIAPSTSMNVYVLSHALRPLWNEGDRVIVAAQNHEANAGPWHRLAQTGIEVVEWPVDPATGSLDLDALDGLLTDRTRLVAFPHVSNLIGEINDVAAITRKVHDAGALVCVDAVAYAPHRPIDVKAWDVDFYAFSFYKVFGPHMGCLYGRKDLLREARNQYHFFVGEDATSKKLNPAGPQHEMIASLAGIADYIDAIHAHHRAPPANTLNQRAAQCFEIIADHERNLAEPFVDFLTSKPNVRLFGPATADASVRAPTFSFVVDGRASAEIPPLVHPERVAIRHGDFYAYRLTQALGLDPEDGVVRASMVHYNTPAEVDRLIAGLDRVL